MVQERLYGIRPKTRVFGQARKRGFDILAGKRLLFSMHQSPPAQLARTIQTKDDRLAEQVDRIRTVFAERALDPYMAEIPGGKTVYKVDTGALRHFQSAFR